MRREKAAAWPRCPNDVLTHQLPVRKLVKRLQCLCGDACVAHRQPGGGPQQNIGRVILLELTADPAVLPNFSRNAVDEISNVAISTKIESHAASQKIMENT